ncbi:MAG: hypothetical protein ABI923_05325 [bacterium]
MNNRSILVAQIESLLQHLTWAEETMGDGHIGGGLRDAASSRFGNSFNDIRRELETLRDDLAVVDDSDALDAYWQTLTNHKKTCEGLFAESLNFLGGALLRALSQVDNLCKISDALLTELSERAGEEWHRFTILAEGNFFTETTGIIRLPFPDYSIWNLPVAVHELGHYVGPRIRDAGGASLFDNELQQLKMSYADATKAKRQANHWREEFSDVFATYASGPAYACSCLVLAFNPADGSAYNDGETHPAYAKRAYLILGMLEEMSGKNHQYDAVVKFLQKLWANNLRAAGQTKELGDDDVTQLDNTLLKIFTILTRTSKVEYKGWARATQLADDLAGKKGVAQMLRAGDTINDVINAAWLWRIRQPEEEAAQVQNITNKAIKLSGRILRNEV